MYLGVGVSRLLFIFSIAGLLFCSLPNIPTRTRLLWQKVTESDCPRHFTWGRKQIHFPEL